jgi:16S rRNA processing protein RimM
LQADIASAATDRGDTVVVLGRVLAPFGVAGWLKVEAYGDDPAALLDHKRWHVRTRRDAAWRAVAVAEGKVHGALLLVRLAEVADRDAAGALKGAEVGLPKEALPKAADNEVFWSDLPGLLVVNREGVALGRVAAVEDFGAHPVLRVVAEAPAGSEAAVERLIPFVPAYVDGVDLPDRRITVDWQADY